jgi:RND family efflux transporter MFP subunit
MNIALVPGARLAGLALLLALGACSKPAPAPAPLARVAWFTATAAGADDASYTGVVHARTESNLGFRVGGKVLARLVDAGDNVAKGQPLMRLDVTDFALARNAADAAVAAAQARQVQAAAEEVRLRKLAATGAVATQAYEVAKAAADAAAAQLSAEQARARQAGHQADYTVLRADMDGVVMEVPAEPGQVVAAGQTVVRLAHGGAREAIVNLPESALAAARRPAQALLYSQPDAPAGATLRELSAVADAQTRTYQARYTLGDAAARAPLGATVTIRLGGAGGGAIAAPVSALVDKGNGPGVWVIDPKTSQVALRPVSIAQLGEEQVRLAAGLAAGERVVAFGGHLLKPGQKVELLVPVKTGGGS